MKLILASCAAVVLCGGLAAQGQRAPEPLSSWKYFKAIGAPRQPAGVVSVLLDREVLERSRADGADLRLYDRDNREIPFLFRILRAEETDKSYPVREFNRGVEGGAAQIFCDLGEQPQEHNQVEIDTEGTNFRRLADLDGSPDNVRWSRLASDAILFRFAAEGKTVQQQAIAYPVSRYRFLRIRVNRDPQVDKTAPQIATINVRRAVRMRGEFIPFAVYLEGREADRSNGRPASVWRLDLGIRGPVERLVLSAGFEAFSRPFELQDIDTPSEPVTIASGELTRREEIPEKPATIDFTEHFARRLKLIVTDDRNTPLPITAVTAFSTARRVVFDALPASAYPVRLYYGNAKAPAPHYDMSARLRSDRVLTAALGEQRDNPVYTPEPKSLSERAPWLVYVVLALASLILAAILANLVRTAERRTAPA